MSSAIIFVFVGLVLLFIYGVGVFALCLYTGETLTSAALEASSWWAAFSISHLFAYLALVLR